MIHEMGFWRSQWHMNVQLQFGHSTPLCFFRVWNNIDIYIYMYVYIYVCMYIYIYYIYRSETKWIQHSCTQSIYYCPLGWRKYCRTDQYMDDKGGGGLQLSVSCALSTMISQCCTFRRLRCWIQFFVWNADECRVLFASTRWRPLHRTPQIDESCMICPRLVHLSLRFFAWHC